MKEFLRTTLAVIVAILLLQFLAFFMFIGFVAVLSKETPITVKPNTVLTIDLSSPVLDKAPTDFQSLFDWQSMKVSSYLELYPVIKAIRHAATDGDIRGISLKADGYALGLANGQEIRDELLKFKESGKFIYAYANGYSQVPYWMASVADTICINPSGLLEWKGLASHVIYYKDALKKFGIEPQVVRHGKFKSAVEPFLDNKMSDANRLQTQVLLNTIWENISQAVAAGRNTTKEKLDAIANEKILIMPNEAQGEGLIDAILYRGQYDSLLIARTTGDHKKDVREITLTKYVEKVRAGRKLNLKAPKIAIVYAQGNIIDGQEAQKDIAGDRYAEIIKEVRKDSTIKAVVLRVNSPGGSALASDIIWRELELLKQEKPLIVSMGEYAASGGYYIAAPAHRIVANPSTLTGSIGVFGLFMTFEKLAKDKIGINPEVVATHKYSDMGSAFRSMRPEEQVAMQSMVEHVYTTFTGCVAKGRRMTPEAVDSIGQGRVWTGADALKIGLVDELGGLFSAIDDAAEMAEIEDYRIATYPKTADDPMNMVMSKLMSSKVVQKFLPQPKVLPFAELPAELNRLLSSQGVRAELPYYIEIK